MSNKVTASELLVEYDRLDYSGQLSLGKSERTQTKIRIRI